MRRPLFALLLACAAAPACGGDGTPAAGDALDADAAEVDAGPDGLDAPEGPPVYDAWPAPPEGPVTRVPILDDQTLDGDLTGGADPGADWGWPAAVACWPFAGKAPFEGPHVLYGLATPLAAGKDLQVTLTPAPGVDLNLYAFANPVGIFHVPPEVPRATACLTSAGAGPGAAEGLTLRDLSAAQEWLIGVTAPSGAAEGAFQLRLARP